MIRSQTKYSLLILLLVSSESSSKMMMAAAFSWSPAPSAVSAPSTGFHTAHTSRLLMTQDDNALDGATTAAPDAKRRLMFTNVLKRTAATACACSGCFALSPHAACGLAQITAPPADLLQAYDLPRNMLQDAAFAQGMAVGMVDYEREALPKKKELFGKLMTSLKDIPEPVIVEVGMGSFPNALYYKKVKGLDIIGVDPNDRMEGFARDSASRAGLLSKGDNLRIVHGVSEALPLADNSADAVVCTLTLCSVVDPARSVAEIKRVLKPGGKFLFWEHVLSQTDPTLAQRQVELTPNQVKRADGCHLDRKTGDVIRAAGFQKLDLEYLELKEFAFLNPTVCGIATA